jgi:thiol-disulfide isomerase/thioredoxin
MDRPERCHQGFEISNLRSQIAIIFVCLASYGVALAAEPNSAQPTSAVKWFQSYSAGIDAALAQKRPALVKFHADWCEWCKKLDEEVLTKPEVTAPLKQFVCISVDAEKEIDVALAFDVASLPRVLVINTHDEIVGDWIGFRAADEFTKLLHDIEPYLTMETGMTKRPVVRPSPVQSRPDAAATITIPNDPNSLLGLLGHQQSAVRQKVIEALVKLGQPMTPLLVQALDQDYLGIRIAACKTLRAITGRDIDFDPWAPRAERAQAIQALIHQLQQPAPAPAKIDAPPNTTGAPSAEHR